MPGHLSKTVLTTLALTAFATIPTVTTHAAVTFGSQSRSAETYVQRQDNGDVLDQAFDFAIDDSLYTPSVFARYDVPEGGVVDAEASQTSSYDSTAIDAEGFVGTNATNIASNPGVFSAVYSTFDVDFTLDTATWVRLTGTLTSTRDATSSPPAQTIEISSSVELLTSGSATIFNAFNDEARPPVHIDEYVYLQPGDYQLVANAFAGEQADELFDVDAAFDVLLEFDTPPVPTPGSLGLLVIGGAGLARRYR